MPETFHNSFGPPSGQDSNNPVSPEIPSRCRPRHCGQSGAAERHSDGIGSCAAETMGPRQAAHSSPVMQDRHPAMGVVFTRSHATGRTRPRMRVRGLVTKVETRLMVVGMPAGENDHPILSAKDSLENLRESLSAWCLIRLCRMTWVR